MNKIEKVIEENDKEHYLQLIKVVAMYPESKSSQDELAKLIIEDQTKLLKAVIEEIEERKKWLEENQVSEGLFEKILITEDDKIINLIKESIK